MTGIKKGEREKKMEGGERKRDRFDFLRGRRGTWGLRDCLLSNVSL